MNALGTDGHPASRLSGWTLFYTIYKNKFQNHEGFKCLKRSNAIQILEENIRGYICMKDSLSKQASPEL